MFEDIFRHKKAIAAKLKAYGFRRSCGVFRYDRDILNGEFHLEIILGAVSKKFIAAKSDRPLT